MHLFFKMFSVSVFEPDEPPNQQLNLNKYLICRKTSVCSLIIQPVIISIYQAFLCRLKDTTAVRVSSF